jgi:hypothetical protein
MTLMVSLGLVQYPVPWTSPNDGFSRGGELTGGGGDAGLLVGTGPCPPPDVGEAAARGGRALDTAAGVCDGAALGRGDDVLVGGAVAVSGCAVDDGGAIATFAGAALCEHATRTPVIAAIVATSFQAG